ncbi:MAG: VOC family protein [Acidimicrobiales bacterium]
MTVDRYIPGVPCWVDSFHPDPHAAATFYSGLFGWECEPEPEGSSLLARLGGADVVALGPVPGTGDRTARWNTYVRVEDADATAARAVAAGGTVVVAPVDIGSACRIAMIADPEGAVVGLWQRGDHQGSSVVNEPGSVVFNDLHTRDVARATDFYSRVFGWEVVSIGGAPMWALPGYGAFLDSLNPGMLDGLAESGAPAGFENVVASMSLIPEDDSSTPAHWGVTFGVADTDAAVATAADGGGRVIAEPVDAPWVRFAVLADPQGAVFTASQYVPENAGTPA